MHSSAHASRVRFLVHDLLKRDLKTTTTAVKTWPKKMNLLSVKLIRLFGPAQYVKCRRLFLELNSKICFIQVQKGEGNFVVVCPRLP